MALAWVVEYANMPVDGLGNYVLCGEEPAIAEQVVSFTTSSVAVDNAFNAKTQLVMIHVDTACHFKFGTSPTASKTTGGTPGMAANETRYYGVVPSSGLKIAFIDDS